MTPPGQSDTEDRVVIERRVALENNGGKELVMRRDSADALWLKPELDGDGEYHIELEQLVAALDELGLNRADLMVGRWAR